MKKISMMILILMGGFIFAPDSNADFCVNSCEYNGCDVVLIQFESKHTLILNCEETGYLKSKDYLGSYNGTLCGGSLPCTIGGPPEQQ